MFFRLVFSLVPIAMVASSGLSISFPSLQKLDALAAGKIENSDDAKEYVKKSVALCVFGDLSTIREELESHLAAAELSVAKDPNKLVSDGRVADAFNYISEEFGVEHPAHLTAEDILQYRSVQAALWPHLFNPKCVSGSRPVSAIVIIYQLWYNGGITEGVRNMAKRDLPPGSLKVIGGRTVGHAGITKNVDVAGAEYQLAGRSYLAQGTPQQIGHFFERLADIIAPPNGRQL